MLLSNILRVTFSFLSKHIERNIFFYLGSGNLLYFQCVVEQWGGREVLSDIIFENLHAHVWVVDLGSDPKLEEPL